MTPLQFYLTAASLMFIIGAIAKLLAILTEEPTSITTKTEAMNDKFEKLGQLIDSLDNLAHTIQLPISDHIHLDQMRMHLPEKVKALKESFIEITGENPWE